MIGREKAHDLLGATVVDRAGDRLGKLAAVYLDNTTEQPEWVAVRGHLLQVRDLFVPLAGAALTGDGNLRVGVTKDQVESAPDVDTRLGELSAEDEERLYRHYRTTAEDSTGGSPGTAHGGSGSTGGAASAPTGDDAMTRSEERLQAGTRSEVTGRARLRKYTVTEQVTVTVPVTREEVRLEQDDEALAQDDQAEVSSPPDDRDRPADEEPPAAGMSPEPLRTETVGGEQPAADGAPDLILYEQRPVIGVETVPVERVRLAKHTTTEQQTVSGEVRKERIAVEDDTDSDSD